MPASGILTRHGPVSPAGGGCGVVHDPDLPAERAVALWRPELSPSTLILAPPPPGVDPLPPINIASLAPTVVVGDAIDGERLIIAEASGDLHIWLPQAYAVGGAAIILPVDASCELRLDVAERFLRRLHGQPDALLPPALQLTGLQRTRLIQMLLAHDIQKAGGGPRDVATQVLGSTQARLPAIEWKDSAARRHANRLIHDASQLVNGGYSSLLRGR